MTIAMFDEECVCLARSTDVLWCTANSTSNISFYHWYARTMMRGQAEYIKLSWDIEKGNKVDTENQIASNNDYWKFENPLEFQELINTHGVCQGSYGYGNKIILNPDIVDQYKNDWGRFIAIRKTFLIAFDNNLYEENIKDFIIYVASFDAAPPGALGVQSEERLKRAEKIRLDVAKRNNKNPSKVLVILDWPEETCFTDTQSDPGGFSSTFNGAFTSIRVHYGNIMSVCINFDCSDITYITSVAHFAKQFELNSFLCNFIDGKEIEHSSIDIASTLANRRKRNIEQESQRQEQLVLEAAILEKQLDEKRRVYNERINNNPEFLLKDVKTLARFKSVRSVRIARTTSGFSPAKIIITTEPLEIGVGDADNYDYGSYKDITIPLGEFAIIITPEILFSAAADSITEGISIYNLTNRRIAGGNWDHPHIDGGKPCYSGWEVPIMQAIYNMSLVSVYETLLGFLRTFNPHDTWGRNIRHFDSAGKFGNIWYASEDSDHDEYENGDYDRPGHAGEWEWYDEGVNGEWREAGGWEWYSHQENGEFEDVNYENTWRWYEEDINGHYPNGYGEGFVFYDDDDNYEQDSYGNWREIETEEEEEVAA